MDADQRTWAEMRGTVDKAGRWYIRSECENLTAWGRCGVYANRPRVCVRFEAGSPECLAARKREGITGKDSHAENKTSETTEN